MRYPCTSRRSTTLRSPLPTTFDVSQFSTGQITSDGPKGPNGPKKEPNLKDVQKLSTGQDAALRRAPDVQKTLNHPGGNPGANLKSISHGNRWFLTSTPTQMPPESGGICGICPWVASRVVDGCADLVVAVSSHGSATFLGEGGPFCGRVARLATRQGLMDLSSPAFLPPHRPGHTNFCLRTNTFKMDPF